MGMQTIEELFEHELKDIYSAEHSLLDALEQMAERELRPRDQEGVHAAPQGDAGADQAARKDLPVARPEARSRRRAPESKG